ncbi:MAG: hypothetical protein Q4E83_00365 [bacterium]|nr:hypothetical protein [bacterium]
MENKICPFAQNKDCNTSCPLFISDNDLNEFVSARLSSIGVMDRKNGLCSLKMLALSQSRMIFENTNTRG